MNKKLECRFTLCMPDGFLLSVPVYEGESAKEKIDSCIKSWYERSNNNPKLFGHVILEEKCPKMWTEITCKRI